MRSVLIWIFAALVLAVGVSAQDGTPRLRVPTLTEYLEIILSLDYDFRDVEDLSQVLLSEINFRYGNQLQNLPYALLRQSFATLYGDGFYYYELLPFQDMWENARITAWLREHEIDLAQQDWLQFDDYDLLVTSVDFNQDGISEFIVDVVRLIGGCANNVPCERYNHESVQYQTLLVMAQESPGQHHLVPTPLGWLTSGYHYRAPQSGILVQLGIDDVDGDGKPEWKVASTSGGYDGATAQLYILGWHNGELIDLATPPIWRTVMFSGGPPDIRDWSGYDIVIADPETLVAPTEQLEIAPTVFVTPTQIPITYATWDAFWDFYHGEYAALAAGIEMEAAADPSFEGSLYTKRMLYLRAVALEALGREEEAAAQYAAIATDDRFPELAALAALHLEPTEGQ